MSNEADKLWAEMESGLRCKKKLHPLTPEEADRELKFIPKDQVTDDEINEILEAVATGQFTTWTVAPDFGELSGIDTSEVEADSLQLFRNVGEADSETQDLIGRLQQEADDEDDHGKVDENGLEGNSQPPGKGR